MRVAYDPRAFFDQRFGGVSRYITRLALGMPKLGAEAMVFAPVHRNEHLKDLPRSMVTWSKLARILAKSGLYHPCYENSHVRRMIAAWKPEVLHETYYDFRSLGPENVPRVVTVHDMVHELFPNMFPPGEPTGRQKEAAVRRADHIICVSENTKRDLIQILGVAEERITVIHHGVEPIRLEITGADSIIGAAMLEGTRRPYLLYVGQRAGYKNFNALLRAYASAEDIVGELDLIAFGGGDFRSEEMQLMQDLNLNPLRVRQMSGNDGALAALYRGASVFVYPSLYEGFGLPPLEAMSANCPVVSSKASCMPEVLGDAAEFFDPTEIDSITESLRRVLYDSAYAEALKARGAEKALKYSWERCVRRTHEVYSALVS